jgi:hypothetical protein
MNNNSQTDTLVICGDSFNVGIGLVDMVKQRYGQLVADHFGWNLLTLARGSASNYAVHLQGVYASNLKPKPKCVILSFTSCDRVEWLSDNNSDHYTTIHLNNLNYHQYPPHLHPQPHHDEPLDFYLKDKPEYSPRLLTEQITAVADYLDRMKNKIHDDYYHRMHGQTKYKLETILNHYMEIWANNSIKTDYDIGLILSAYTKIKNSGVNCLVLSNHPKFKSLIPSMDLIDHNWFDLSKQYPDTIGSHHADFPAHQYTAELIINRMKENDYDR